MLDNIPIDLGRDRSYSCSMRALAAFHGKNYPRWYSSTIAAFHTNFYYYEWEKGFSYFFSTPAEATEGTVNGLNSLGFETKHIYGLDWLESWEVLKTAVEKRAPVMIGPLNAAELGCSEQPFDHYCVISGITGKEVVLKDPAGTNNLKLDTETFRKAWEGKIPYDKKKHKYSMIISKRRTQPKSGEKETCMQALKKVRERYYSQQEIQTEEGILLSGRRAIEALAEKVSSKKKAAQNLLPSVSWNENAGNVTRFETALFAAYARKFWDTEKMKELNQELNILSEAWLEAETALKQASGRKAGQNAADLLLEVADKEDKVKEKLLKLTF